MTRPIKILFWNGTHLYGRFDMTLVRLGKRVAKASLGLIL